MLGGEAGTAADKPEFNAQGQLARPLNYREWVYLSSGVGMTYGPLGAQAPPENPLFDNVFASPSAYKSFLATGIWPDKTMLVLEVRHSQSKGSINQRGHFQGEIRGVEVEVKDESRFPGKWAFFDFPQGVNQAKQIPGTAACYSCHKANGAVDNTFVQFYPTLLPVARAKGTVIPGRAE